MKRKVIVFSFIFLCLASLFVLPPLMKGLKLTGGEIRKTYEIEKSLSLEDAKRIFPEASSRIREDKKYVMKYKILKVWKGWGHVRKDTLERPALIEKDL